MLARKWVRDLMARPTLVQHPVDVEQARFDALGASVPRSTKWGEGITRVRDARERENTKCETLRMSDFERDKHI